MPTLITPYTKYGVYFLLLFTLLCVIMGLGDNMKFYDYAFEEPGNDIIKKYVVESYANNQVLKLCFDECDCGAYFNDMKYMPYMRRGNTANFIGEDNYIYAFSFDGSREMLRKLTKKDNRDILNRHIKLANRMSRDSDYREKILRKYTDSQLNFVSGGFKSYDKYLYVNRKDNYIIPFRFKKAKKANAPLLVYYQGAGALGHDNFKPFFEFRSFLFGKKLPDCNILIPQAPYGVNFGAEMTAFYKYVNQCILLIKSILHKYDMDNSRVYCFGTSFGGSCVWENIYDASDLFACAVPVMGLLINRDEKIPKLTNTYNGMPVWIAHSSDDTNVRIDSDDQLYNELVKINPEIKYTRWDKYGHKMAGRFYRKEPFIDWMFSQRL